MQLAAGDAVLFNSNGFHRGRCVPLFMQHTRTIGQHDGPGHLGLWFKSGTTPTSRGRR